MQAVKDKGTKLERRLWAMLNAMGLVNWEKNASSVIGKPDVAFHNERVAIFVDGCFWHGCPLCRKKLPETNAEYWQRKIKRNVELAHLYERQLQQDGWIVVRIWEHEIADIGTVGTKILRALEKGNGKLSNITIGKANVLGRQILDEWLDSCTRSGKIARNTVAVGIVVLDQLRRSSPVVRDDVISQGGEVSGARSGLGAILESYDLPRSYLKEVTTRQGHQDGQRLFEQFEWGHWVAEIPEYEREEFWLQLIGSLRELANDWLKRQNLKLDLDRRQAPTTWVNVIVENAKGRSGGVVEQQLVGAKLARRFKGVVIPNHPAHAGDSQTDRAGDFNISQLVYHVTSAPSRNVLQKCLKNIKAGLQPVLLVPFEQENKARILAQDEGIDKDPVSYTHLTLPTNREV